MSYVDPRHIPTFQQWSDFMYPLLEPYGVIEQFTVGSDWQSWAAGLLSLNAIQQKGAPSPYQFDDWREWAYRLIETLGTGS